MADKPDDHLSPLARGPLSRRQALRLAGGGVAAVATAGVAGVSSAAPAPAELFGSMSGSIDYHANRVALSELQAALQAATPGDPAVAQARLDALEGLTLDGGAALLGAFTHHLIGHASADGVELALLGRAADLWGRGVRLCADLGVIRADLEGALDDPGNPGSAARFNAAAVAVQELANTVNAMRVEVDALRGDIRGLPHLRPHPRQQDKQSDQWDWANLVLGRRTDALVHNLFRRATDRRTLAFAVGAAASYGINVAGTPYIGAVVGGPRRTHRYRNRLARNAMGSWLAANHAAARPLGELAASITFGPAADPALPVELASLVRDAMADTFDLTATAAPPDLELGYRRLLRHLALLDSFPRPEVPKLPLPRWVAALFGDAHNPPPSLRPQHVDVGGMDGGGVAATYGANSPGQPSSGQSDSGKAAATCGIVFLGLLLVDLIQAFVQCVGQWANDNPCTYWDNMLLKKLWEMDPPDPREAEQPRDPGMGSAGLTVIAGRPEAPALVAQLYDAHRQLWEALDRARVFLATFGLTYPTGLLDSPLFAQFTSSRGERPWPHREEPESVSTYHLYPESSVEFPMVLASPYGVGATPAMVLTTGRPTATDVAMHLWNRIALGVPGSRNDDLDADRGWNHPCWATTGSVHADPVGVRVLGYHEQ